MKAPELAIIKPVYNEQASVRKVVIMLLGQIQKITDI